MLELPSPAVVSLALVFLFLVALAPVFFALGKVVLFQLFHNFRIFLSNHVVEYIQKSFPWTEFIEGAATTGVGAV